MMTKEGSTKIVNFMTFGAGFPLLVHGHTSHKVKMHNISSKIFSIPVHRSDKLNI